MVLDCKNEPVSSSTAAALNNFSLNQLLLGVVFRFPGKLELKSNFPESYWIQRNRFYFINSNK
jgi:hypothetical protein